MFALPLTAALLASTSLGVPESPGVDALPGHAQEEAPPPLGWKGGLTAGAVWTDGNSVTSSANATFNAENRSEKDRWTYDAFFNYADQESESASNPGTDDTEVSQLNYGAGAKYDYFATEKLYYLANASAKHDEVAQLYLRYIIGAGVGYQVRETEKLKWGVETGLAYVNKDYDPDPIIPPPVDPEDPDSRGWAVRLASNLAWQISSTTAFEQVTEVLPSLEESEDLIAHLDNRLKMSITEKWIAQLQYVLDFDDSTPAGVEETDHRVVLGLGWSFGS